MVIAALARPRDVGVAASAELSRRRLGPSASSARRREFLLTVQAADGLVREIDGILRLELKEKSFSTTFELETTYPGPEAVFPARVVGWGQGLVVGDTMAGTVSSRMARLDEPAEGSSLRLPAEELVIMSSSVARFNAHGRLQV